MKVHNIRLIGPGEFVKAAGGEKPYCLADSLAFLSFIFYMQ